MPDNFNVCQKRTQSLAYRWLAQSPGLLQTYNNILKEQLRRDFIETVPDARKSYTAHYISHHPLKKNSDTTPIRIVYDCSCHQSIASEHPSQNDWLLNSPPFLVDPFAIILRFRRHQYGLSTDIKKAFDTSHSLKRTGISHVSFGCQTHWTPPVNLLSTDLSECCLVQ